MTSIFPNTEAGGLIIRDPETGAPVEQPEVENAAYPMQLNISCDLTALPSTCDAKVAPEQINAIVSELIAFYVAMAPTREWDCDSLDNLAEAFEQFVADLGSSGGGVSCNVTIGNAGDINTAFVMFCDENSLQKWTIHGENGLIEFIFDSLCEMPTSDVADGDFVLYCRDGQLGKGQALFLNLYTGPWVQNRTYSVKNMVQYQGLLYSPNAPIPAGTPFTIGSTGATWREVSPTAFQPFDPNAAYSKDTIISYQGGFYAANEDIPAGTAFVVGSTGATWRVIDLANTSILDFDAGKDYRKYNVVKLGPNLYRAIQDVAAGLFDNSFWELLTPGERNIYRGEYQQSQAYILHDLVNRSGILFAANGPIAANTPFLKGTTGATWRIVSINSIEFDPSRVEYLPNELVTYQGNLFLANGIVPSSVIPAPPNIGTVTGTWRAYTLPIKVDPYSAAKTYQQRELFLRPNPSFPTENQLWGAGAGPWPATFNPLNNELYGERNKFRGKWSLEDTYRKFDVVLKADIAEPYGTLFEAVADMAAGTAFNYGTGGNWKRIGSATNIKIYSQAQAYSQGDMVLTAWGLYVANANILANTPFVDGPNNFEPYNSGRRPTFNYAGDVDVLRDHRNATVIFSTTTGTRNYNFIGDVGHNVGDTIFVMTRGSQMQINASPQNVVRSVYGNTSIAAPYASVVLRCIGKSAGVCEWLLTGDLQTI